MPILYNEQFEKLTTANEILPPQVGESGKVLQSDGLTANWSNLDTTTAITDGSILLSKLVPLEPNSLVGNPTGTTELLVPITLGTNLSFSDNVLSATLSPNSVTALELANNAVDTSAILDLNVTNAKLAAMPASTLKGRTNSAGPVQDLTLDSHFQTTGNTLSLVPGSLVAGDFGAGAVGTTVLQNNSVSNAKLTQAPALTLKGNAINATNNVGDITLGSGLSFVAGQLTATSTAGQEFPLWTPNTAYLAGDSVKFFIDSQTVYLRRNSDGTSDSIMGTTEMSTWEYIGQKAYSNFPTSISIVPLGFKIFVNNILWQSNQSRYTFSTFDASEQTFWTQLTFPSSATNLTNLAGLRGDGSSIPVADTRLTYDASNASGISFLSNANGGFRLETSATELQMNAISKTATGSALPTVIKGQNVVAGTTDGGNGKIRLIGGNCTGSGGSSIDFLMAPFGGANGTTNNPAIQNFAMYSPNSNTGHFVSNLADGIFAPNINTVGNITVSGDSTGVTNVGTLGTGKVNIGTASKNTDLNGFISEPAKGIFYAERTTSNQATFVAGSGQNIQWNFSSSNSLGNTLANISGTSINILSAGTYIINGLVGVQSTAVTRGRLVVQPNSASFAGGTNSYGTAFRLPTANTAEIISFNYIVRLATPGTIEVTITLAAGTGTILATNTTLASASTTEIHITKIG